MSEDELENPSVVLVARNGDQYPCIVKRADLDIDRHRWSYCFTRAAQRLGDRLNMPVAAYWRSGGEAFCGYVPNEDSGR